MMPMSALNDAWKVIDDHGEEKVDLPPHRDGPHRTMVLSTVWRIMATLQPGSQKILRMKSPILHAFTLASLTSVCFAQSTGDNAPEKA